MTSRFSLSEEIARTRRRSDKLAAIRRDLERLDREIEDLSDKGWIAFFVGLGLLGLALLLI